MNTRLVIVCLLFFAIFLNSDNAPVYSQQKKPTDRLVIAISSDFKPYSFLNSNGKPAGLFVDIWQLWSQKTGNKIEFIVSDWKTSVENLKSGKADIHSGLASSPERSAWISPIKKFYEVETALFYPVLSGKVTDITSFYGKTIATVKGTKTEKVLSLNYPKITVISCTNRLELLKVTQEGKAAGFVAFEMVGKNLINDQGLSGEYAVLDSVFEKEKLYTSIRKENSELAARIYKSFDQLSNAEFAEIEARWIPEENKRFFRTNAAVELSPSEQAWLDRKLTVRVRVGDSPPYQMTTPVPQGISVDYLKLIGKRFGINFVFVINKTINWEQSVKDLSGEHQWLDMVVAIKRTPEREKIIAFTDDYLSSPWVIVNRTDSNFVSRMQDLAGKKVTVEKGFAVNELIKRDYPQITIVPVTTSLEALQSVASGVSDAYIANLAIATYLIRDKGLANLKVAAPAPFGNHDQSMGIRKDWQELASIISKGLVAMSDAEESEIRNRWLSIRYEFGIRSKEVWSWIAGLSALFLLALTAALAWSRRLKQEKVEQERLLSILEATTNELHVFDIHSWVYSYVNKSALHNLGYTLDQMQGMTPLEILPELSRDECAAVLAPLVSHEKTVVKLEAVHRRKDGTDYPVEVCLQLVEARSSSSSSSSHFLAVVQDISERKRTLEALLESEECFRSTFEQAAVGIAQVYPDGRWLRVNQRLCDIVGYTRDELLQCTFQDITHPEDLNTDLSFVQQVLAGDISTYSMEKRYIRKDHSLVWVNLTVGIVRDETGAPKYFVSVIEDIAARKLEEDKVASASHEWQKTFDSINDSISLIDVDQHIKRCNLATSHLLGLEFSDIVHKPCWMLFHGSDTPIADCPMVRSKKSLKSESATIQHCDRWLEVTVDPILSDQGVMTGAVHIVRDVTERIDLTNSLQEANELFSQFMKYSPIYTFIKEVTDTGSRVLKASDNFSDMTGIASQKMLGRTMHELFPKEFADKITAEDLQVVTSQQVQRLEEYLNDGIYITYKFPIKSPDGRRIVAGYTIDITERKRLEEELRRQASVISGVLESTDSAVFSIDNSCRYTSFNASHKKIMEGLYNADIHLGDLITGFMTTEDAVIAKANLDKALAGEAFVLEADSGDSAMVRTVFEISHNPIRNSKGVVEGAAIFARDISEKRKSEESMREMQAQLMQSDKMATIGQLAAGVAHEINNPMGFVSSNMVTLAKYVEKYNRYIELLEDEVRSRSNETMPEHLMEAQKTMKLDYIFRDINVLLDESNEGIERVKRIVRDLRTFSRAETTEMVSADLNGCMDSTINIVINEIKYAAELYRSYGELPRVPCNVQQISQVFMNLLINAAHAIQSKSDAAGEIVIRTWCDEKSAFVSVSDTGCGITPENCSKIFDAFFTTKEVGMGTGLGLSISAGIIHKHGGDITVTSEVGTGSVFTVRLPLKSALSGNEVTK